jgi:YgiT-type zinc finger domain-containing protein
MSSDRCANCGSERISIKLVTRTYGRGPGIVVIEDIPLVSCGKCGEVYFSAETMHEIERVRSHRKAFGASQTVTVAQLPITADELQRRIAELKSGKVKAIRGDKVFDRIRRRLRNLRARRGGR